MRARCLFVVLLILATVGVAVSWAEVPSQISFQGKLTHQNGGPIADANYQLTFKIYDAPTLGNALWIEQDTTTTRAGLFQLMLGEVNPIPKNIFIDTSAYLSIEFAGVELQPRKPFRSVGYAYHAAVADSATMTDADWVINGDNVYHLNGNVGIGTADPSCLLDVSKDVGGATNLLKVSGYGGDINAVMVKSNGNMLTINQHGTNDTQKGLYINHDGPGYGAYILGDAYLDGNFGIGTTTPAYKLDVAGDVQATNFRGNFIGTIDNALHWSDHNWGDTYPYAGSAGSADVWDGHHWGESYPYAVGAGTASNSDLVDGVHNGSLSAAYFNGLDANHYLRSDVSGTLNGNLGINGTLSMGNPAYLNYYDLFFGSIASIRCVSGTNAMMLNVGDANEIHFRFNNEYRKLIVSYIGDGLSNGSRAVLSAPIGIRLDPTWAVVDIDGHLKPVVDNAYDLGGASMRWHHLWTSALTYSGACYQGHTVEEKLPFNNTMVEDGDVIEFNPETNSWMKCSTEKSPNFVSVAVKLSAQEVAEDPENIEGKEGRPMVMGVYHVKVAGRVSKGQILVSSSTPGYAMAVDVTPENLLYMIGRPVELKNDAGTGIIKAYFNIK
jgi:hypothetical protein